MKRKNFPHRKDARRRNAAMIDTTAHDLSENEIETRDRIYDRLICGADWQELADVLDGHMPWPS